MSEKERQKKDGKDKNKRNQAKHRLDGGVNNRSATAAVGKVKKEKSNPTAGEGRNEAKGRSSTPAARMHAAKADKGK
jgi:hypothetical protein